MKDLTTKDYIMINYFYSNGEKKGPFTFEELKQEKIEKETLIWFEGLDDWKPAKEIRELDAIFELNPPPIPKMEFKTEQELSRFNDNGEHSFNGSDQSESSVKQKQGMFSKPFSFEGRIRRTEFGISFIITFFIYTFVLSIMKEVEGYAALLWLVKVPIFWFYWAQGAKRCHDLGNSGWWQLIPFYVFWLIFQKGEPEINEYGVNPKN